MLPQGQQGGATAAALPLGHPQQQQQQPTFAKGIPCVLVTLEFCACSGPAAHSSLSLSSAAAAEAAAAEVAAAAASSLEQPQQQGVRCQVELSAVDGYLDDLVDASPAGYFTCKFLRLLQRQPAPAGATRAAGVAKPPAGGGTGAATAAGEARSGEPTYEDVYSCRVYGHLREVADFLRRAVDLYLIVKKRKEQPQPTALATGPATKGKRQQKRLPQRRRRVSFTPPPRADPTEQQQHDSEGDSSGSSSGSSSDAESSFLRRRGSISPLWYQQDEQQQQEESDCCRYVTFSLGEVLLEEEGDGGALEHNCFSFLTSPSPLEETAAATSGGEGVTAAAGAGEPQFLCKEVQLDPGEDASGPLLLWVRLQLQQEWLPLPRPASAEEKKRQQQHQQQQHQEQQHQQQQQPSLCSPLWSAAASSSARLPGLASSFPSSSFSSPPLPAGDPFLLSLELADCHSLPSLLLCDSSSAPAAGRAAAVPVDEAAAAAAVAALSVRLGSVQRGFATSDRAVLQQRQAYGPQENRRSPSASAAASPAAASSFAATPPAGSASATFFLVLVSSWREALLYLRGIISGDAAVVLHQGQLLLQRQRSLKRVSSVERPSAALATAATAADDELEGHPPQHQQQKQPQQQQDPQSVLGDGRSGSAENVRGTGDDAIAAAGTGTLHAGAAPAAAKLAAERRNYLRRPVELELDLGPLTTRISQHVAMLSRDDAFAGAAGDHISGGAAAAAARAALLALHSFAVLLPSKGHQRFPRLRLSLRARLLRLPLFGSYTSSSDNSSTCSSNSRNNPLLLQPAHHALIPGTAKETPCTDARHSEAQPLQQPQGVQQQHQQGIDAVRRNEEAATAAASGEGEPYFNGMATPRRIISAAASAAAAAAARAVASAAAAAAKTAAAANGDPAAASFNWREAQGAIGGEAATSTARAETAAAEQQRAALQQVPLSPPRPGHCFAPPAAPTAAGPPPEKQIRPGSEALYASANQAHAYRFPTVVSRPRLPQERQRQQQQQQQQQQRDGGRLPQKLETELMQQRLTPSLWRLSIDLMSLQLTGVLPTAARRQVYVHYKYIPFGSQHQFCTRPPVDCSSNTQQVPLSNGFCSYTLVASPAQLLQALSSTRLLLLVCSTTSRRSNSSGSNSSSSSTGCAEALSAQQRSVSAGAYGVSRGILDSSSTWSSATGAAGASPTSSVDLTKQGSSSSPAAASPAAASSVPAAAVLGVCTLDFKLLLQQPLQHHAGAPHPYQTYEALLPVLASSSRQQLLQQQHQENASATLRCHPHEKEKTYHMPVGSLQLQLYLERLPQRDGLPTGQQQQQRTVEAAAVAAASAAAATLSTAAASGKVLSTNTTTEAAAAVPATKAATTDGTPAPAGGLCAPAPAAALPSAAAGPRVDSSNTGAGGGGDAAALAAVFELEMWKESQKQQHLAALTREEYERRCRFSAELQRAEAARLQALQAKQDAMQELQLQLRRTTQQLQQKALELQSREQELRGEKERCSRVAAAAAEEAAAATRRLREEKEHAVALEQQKLQLVQQQQKEAQAEAARLRRRLQAVEEENFELRQQLSGGASAQLQAEVTLRTYQVSDLESKLEAMTASRDHFLTSCATLLDKLHALQEQVTGSSSSWETDVEAQVAALRGEIVKLREVVLLQQQQQVAAEAREQRTQSVRQRQLLQRIGTQQQLLQFPHAKMQQQKQQEQPEVARKPVLMPRGDSPQQQHLAAPRQLLQHGCSLREKTSHRQQQQVGQKQQRSRQQQQHAGRLQQQDIRTARRPLQAEAAINEELPTQPATITSLDICDGFGSSAAAAVATGGSSTDVEAASATAATAVGQQHSRSLQDTKKQHRSSSQKPSSDQCGSKQRRSTSQPDSCSQQHSSSSSTQRVDGLSSAAFPEQLLAPHTPPLPHAAPETEANGSNSFPTCSSKEQGLSGQRGQQQQQPRTSREELGKRVDAIQKDLEQLLRMGVYSEEHHTIKALRGKIKYLHELQHQLQT